MAAQIVMDDGGGPVIGSVITTEGTTVNLSNFDNTGVLGFEWELVDRPQGSSAVLSSLTGSTSSFVADITGTFIVQLRTYTDAARTTLDDGDVQGAAVLLESPFDWRIPGAGETTQFDAARGWADARETAIRDVHSFMNSGAPTIQGAVNEEITTLGSEVVLGGFVFNGGRVGVLSPSLEALGSLVVASTGSAEVRLYDLGAPGTPIVPVLRSEVSFPNGTAGDPVKATQALTVASAPGVNADEIHDVERVYELRAEITGATAGDSLKILSAGMRFN